MENQWSSMQTKTWSRRQFVKTMAWGSCLVGAPNLSFSGAENWKVQGAKNHRYELIENWAQIPKHIQLGYTHGVAVDSQNRVIIHHTGKDSVIQFDTDGKFIRSWGDEFEGGAHGLTLQKEGKDDFLFFSDTNRDLVIKTTLNGEKIWTIQQPKETPVYEGDKPYTPTNIAFAPNGDVYIADGYGSSYIHQYNRNAEYIRTWGGKGSENGQMDCPHGITVDLRGDQPLVLVADRANIRLQYFTLNGEYVKTVTNDLRYPCHFDQRDGDLLIPDLYGRVTIFDRNNQLITHLGSDPEWMKPEGYPNVARETLTPGKFVSPHSACWDLEGNLYVVEWIEYGRITKFRRLT